MTTGTGTRGLIPGYPSRLEKTTAGRRGVSDGFLAWAP